MPPRKRLASAALADDTGTIEARIRRHLAAIDLLRAQLTSSNGIFLPDDIVRYILEFVIGRRHCAQFGIDGTLRPASYDDAEPAVIRLRAINRQWARVGGELIRWLRMPPVVHCRPATLAAAFPNVSRLSLHRCAIDSKMAKTFSATINVFSHRPKHTFVVDVEHCKVVGKPVIDCYGMLARREPYDFECDCEYDDGTSDNIKLVNAMFEFDYSLGWLGPDENLIWGPEKLSFLCSVLARPLCVVLPSKCLANPPPCDSASFRALKLFIHHTRLSPISLRCLTAWLAPRMWQNGQRPSVTWVVDSKEQRDMAVEAVQAFTNQLGIETPIIVKLRL